MADIKIQIQGNEKLRQIMNNPQLIQGPVRTFLKRSALIVEYNIKQLVPVDMGMLRSSVATQLEPTRAMVGPTVDYAPFVEFGTRPHWPPPGALQPWAGRHGFPPGLLGDFLVRRIIARRGTRAHPFMEPAAKASVPAIKKEFEAMILDIGQRWGGGSEGSGGSMAQSAQRIDIQVVLGGTGIRGGPNIAI